MIRGKERVSTTKRGVQWMKGGGVFLRRESVWCVVPDSRLVYRLRITENLFSR